MIYVKRCDRGIHNFQPRYDEVWPEDTALRSLKSASGDFERLLKTMKNKIYVQDICVKCGKVIKRG